MSDGNVLLIDYEYCLGCSSCEISCMESHGYDVENTGIRIVKMGPWKNKNGSWQYDFVPLPTDWCDMCADRLEANAMPACARACNYKVIYYGSIEYMGELFKAKPKMLMFNPRNV